MVLKHNAGEFSRGGFFGGLQAVLSSPLCFIKILPRRNTSQYLLRQGFEEAIHTHAYQYIVESYGLDESEIFNETGKTRVSGIRSFF